MNQSNLVLIDTSFMVALYHHNDKYHRAALSFASQSNYQALLPEVALTETAFLLQRSGGLRSVQYFLDDLQIGGTVIQSLTLRDIDRARNIMTEYASANLDFVDCCLMALSERLNVTRVCTFDRRDFSIFRPKHCEYLELLP
ncbi:MAG: PIN domain-containing protein [Chloroflexi bacterium]|nr:PIN domain-containing protein [Chloroflexota bacterium]MCC6895666.1 PIN domain-containing protein [Anaerolineae bacterium]